MWYRIKNDYLLISVKIKPNAKNNEITGLEDDYLKISLHAQPIEGKANKMLIDYLSKRFAIPKKLIKIIRGEHNNYKCIELPYKAGYFRNRK